MIIFDKTTKTLQIPVGLGNLEVNVSPSVKGVTSIDGQDGDLNLKTVNGNNLLGRGNIDIGFDGAVESAVTQSNEYTDRKIDSLNIPSKTSELTNDSGFLTSAATENMIVRETSGSTSYASAIWTGTQEQYDALGTHSNNVLYFING